MRIVSLLPAATEICFALGLGDDVLGVFARCACACGACAIEARAVEVVAALRERIDRVAERASTPLVRPKTVCLEWLDPLFLGGHWVPEMVGLAGGVDVLGRAGRNPAGWSATRSLRLR